MIKKKNKMNKNNIGVSGEYFVAAELERRGFSATITMRNTEAFDILAINEESGKQYCIQVKTYEKRSNKRLLSKKNERINKKDAFYIFVNLNTLDNPEYYIVPSKVVAESIKSSHEKWLKQPEKNNIKHNDNNMRQFIVDEKYKNKWDLLK